MPDSDAAIRQPPRAKRPSRMPHPDAPARATRPVTPAQSRRPPARRADRLAADRASRQAPHRSPVTPSLPPTSRLATHTRQASGATTSTRRPPFTPAPRLHTRPRRHPGSPLLLLRLQRDCHADLAADRLMALLAEPRVVGFNLESLAVFILDLEAGLEPHLEGLQRDILDA